MAALRGKDRLIVALDVPSPADALDLVDRLGPDVTFYKIGWQLFVTGELKTLFERLAGKNVFIDLKVPGDIGNTIRSVLDFCVRQEVRFLTLSDLVPEAAIEAARAARGARAYPKLLTVPFLSSLDGGDLGEGAPAEVERHILSRAARAMGAGCDGLIASGDAIALLRKTYREAIIVSPGIRPEGSSQDDHKRLATPAEAIEMGADYLVVGRPIRNARDPRDAAWQIIDEIDTALRAASASRR